MVGKYDRDSSDMLLVKGIKLEGESTRPILNVIDTLGPGGAERHLVTLCASLNQGNFASDVFSLSSIGTVYDDALREVGSNVIFGASHHFFSARIMFRLFTVIRQGNYKLLHLYLPLSTLLGVIVGRLCGIQNIVTTVCARKAQFDSPLLRFENYARLQRWIDCYITHYPSELEGIGIPKEKIHFSIAAVDSLVGQTRIPRQQNPLVNLYSLSDSFPLILSIGRLHPDKGQEFAIQAMARVLKRYPAAKLVILGVGADEDRLRRLTDETGLGSKVIFGGFHKSLDQFLSLADIFVKTSVNEGLNGAQLKAMAYGIPTVTFDTGECEYEVPFHEETTLKVPIGDVLGLAGAILRLAENTSLRARLGHAGQAYARQFDSAQVIHNYERIYAELLGTTREHDENQAISVP